MRTIRGSHRRKLGCPRRWMALSVLAALVVMPSRAAATLGELGVALSADFNAGAEKLATLYFSDGSDQDIHAGNGFLLAAGGGAMFFEGGTHRVETLLTLGVKFSTMQPTTNADLLFIRVPIDLLVFYRNEAAHLRVGLGAALYAHSSLSGSGAASDLQFDFKPALARLIQADFVWNEGYLGLRYTRLDYRLAGVDGDIAAHSLGVTAGFFWSFELGPAAAGAASD
jgi:hypothetical protein